MDKLLQASVRAEVSGVHDVPGVIDMTIHTDCGTVNQWIDAAEVDRAERSGGMSEWTTAQAEILCPGKTGSGCT